MPTSMSPEKEIIEKYFAGDNSAFAGLVDLYLKEIYNFIYRLIGSVKDSEDLTQEVFIKVWKNLNKFDIEKNFKTWIFTIAKNTAIDFLRKNKDIPLSSFDDEDGNNFIEDNLIDNEMKSDEVFSLGEDKELIEKALNKISLIQKEVLILRYMNELSFSEISEVLDIPLNTIKSHHNRALIKLRKILTATNY